MNLYITLNEEVDVEEQIQKLNQAMGSTTYKEIGHYDSNGYTTIVIRLENVTTDEEIDNIEATLKQRMNLLEISQYMKFYYILKTGYKCSEVNPKVRKTLRDQGYTVKTYNSHSENGSKAQD